MTGPVCNIVARAGLGNRMLQYLVALHVQRLVPGCRIANVSLPDWGIRHAPVALTGVAETVAEDRLADFRKLASRMRRGVLQRIDYTGNGMWLPHLPDPAICRAAFPLPSNAPATFGDRHLVCPLGIGDRLNGEVLHLPLVPGEYYAGLAAQTGLHPVFVGCIEANAYTARLRALLPDALFRPAADPEAFAIIRQARNIALSVSVLGWLAAWLSHAERIFLPVSGLFNPMQFLHANLLPLGDPRYRFHLFPINHGVPLDRVVEAHRRIAPCIRQVPHAMLRLQFAQAPRFDPPIQDMLAALDVAWYMRENADVGGTGAQRVGGTGAQRDTAVAGTPSKRDTAKAHKHYQWPGASERRLPFALSEPWYAATYPRAAMEVAQGDYTTFAQHYVAVGRARGHRLQPDPALGLSLWQVMQARPLRVGGASAADLARERIALETAVPLAKRVGASLGPGFATLTPHDASLFRYRARTEKVEIYRFRDVVLDAATMALFSGGEPIPETFYMGTVSDYEHAMITPVALAEADPRRHYIIGSNREAGGYYHWMAQALPAIDWGLRQPRPARPVLALPPLQAWQEQTLALLGHADVPRLTLDRSAHYRMASAEHAEFLGIRFAGIVSRRAAETYATLRRQVKPAAGPGAAIYVARTDSARRVARNEAALIAMLEKSGVQIVVPTSLTVLQQLAVFRAARLVIGAHGAGLSNIIACEPGAHLYELVPSHYPNFCYNRLAQCCGLHYWADVFPAAPGDAGTHERTWQIDLTLVAARLDEIRTRMAAREAEHGP